MDAEKKKKLVLGACSMQHAESPHYNLIEKYNCNQSAIYPSPGKN
jgi:hypothetical protein